MQVDWHLLRGDAPRVWSALYDGLSGFNVRWGERERQAWYTYAERHAGVVADYDVVVAHDPQALALARVLSPSAQPAWVWHCHLDTREAQPDVWSDVQRALEPYTAALFPSAGLVRPDLAVEHAAVARPALDPLSPRNVPLADDVVATTLGRLGIDPARPDFATGAVGWMTWDFARAREVCIYDEPAACVERLQSLQEQLPAMYQCILEFNRRGRIPSPRVRQAMRLFADEVMPKLT